MNTILKNLPRKILQINQTNLNSLRTFLSQAYYCNELWEHRLQDPILQKVNPEEFYQDLYQRHSKTGKISAIDVDIFVNALKEDTYVDELLDLTHKLRLSGETGNMLCSTPHAVIRYLKSYKKDEALLKVLDERLNYGIFLEYYIANLLMNDYYKKKEFANGARIASQLMLQDEFENPLSVSLGLLNCYSYLLDPKGWAETKLPEEPEEEVKIRVKYLRNPYDDDHFDLKDPNKIVGKTLASFTRDPKDCTEKSLHLLGLVLYGKMEKAEAFLNNVDKINSHIFKLLPQDNEIHQNASKIPQDSEDILKALELRVKESERITAEEDISAQCKLYDKWSEERRSALAKQNKRLRSEQRLEAIKHLKKDLEVRETKLWFFENEEKIELKILEKEKSLKKRLGKQKEPEVAEETQAPLEIRKN